jgi:naphthalene 1,2-dioxygenase ferredoxin component
MTSDWISVAKTIELPDGGTLQVNCGQEILCLFRIKGQVYATQDTCTHGAASLSEGYVEGEEVECPFHQGLFHIPTGKAVGKPCIVDLRVFEVKEDGEHVFVKNEIS